MAMRIVSLGHLVFAAAMIAVGLLGFVKGDFEGIWNGVPEHLPAREILAYVCASVALACGAGLLFRRTAAVAARVLLLYVVVWLILVKGRYIVLAPLEEGSYQSAGESAVIVAGAWVLYTWLAGEWDERRLAYATGDDGVRIARVLYGLALLAFGFSHFVYLNLTAPLVPQWLPGAPVGWAWFTGGAYLAAGAAVLTGMLARLAAALSTLQMGSFVLLIWIPLVAAGHIGAFQWGEFVATCVLTAGSWAVTDSYRGVPWFALPGRHRQASAAS
jgi:uncharacterized membrane protein